MLLRKARLNQTETGKRTNEDRGREKTMPTDQGERLGGKERLRHGERDGNHEGEIEPPTKLDRF